MRLFITSYQKSGTHQIMPMFMPHIPDVVDRSWNCWVNAPKRYALNPKINRPGVEEVVGNLRQFKGGATKSFGHLSYMPEYAQVFKETATKVLFNIRDPRDIVVAEYGNAQRHFAEERKGFPLYNFRDQEDGKFLYEKEDPITELIILASARWPRWLGWLEHDFVYKVKYEDLRLKPRETVEGICEWLGGEKCSGIDAMVKNAQPNPPPPTFRKGLVGEWITTFQPHHVELSEELLSDIIEKLGYE